jgi:ubiquinone/menaquinone biosynthesis C-methylase UbiE
LEIGLLRLKQKNTFGFLSSSALLATFKAETHLLKHKNMNTNLEQISNAQRDSWDKFSPGWGKWDDLTMGFLGPYGDSIIDYLKPNGSELILDVAAGTGEPGLSIAPMIPNGKVIITDLSEGMLQVAKEKIARSGANNIETATADVSELPYDDNTFDSISCRFGYMFFPDMLLATQEMKRVLKPGGRIATSVWGAPDKNFWVTVMMQNIKKYIEMTPPPEGAPGMFRCAKPGLIAGLFTQAGLTDVSESDVTGIMKCNDAEEYWNFITDVAAPFVNALSGADNETIEKIKRDVINSVNDKYPNSTSIDTSGIVICGRK